MKTIYLAGPLSDDDNPYKWHDQVMSHAPDVDWINPFLIHDDDAIGAEIYNADLDAVRSADAMLLHRIDGYRICGAYIEAGVAGEHDIPVVVWNDAESDVPEFLRWHADAICETMADAISGVLK